MFRFLTPQFISLIFYFLSTPAFAQYKATGSQAPDGNIVPVSGPGSYAVAGTTYRLTNDISSAKSTLFLGKDVTLDLNGKTGNLKGWVMVM